MIGTALHDFDLELCAYVRANLRQHRHDPRFREVLKQELVSALYAYLMEDEDEGQGPHERFLLSYDELSDLQHFAENGLPDLTWFSDPQLHKRSVYAVPEIRAHLSAQTADEWAVASSRFARALEAEDLSLAEGIAMAAEWILDARRLLRAMGAVQYLPYPEGTFPTPSYPEPPPPPSPSEATSAQQTHRGNDAFAAAIAETQTLQREVRDLLVSQRAVKEVYATSEVAEMIGRSEYTVREWCRKGQVQAVKAPNGRSWLIPHAELTRLRNHGPLPEQQVQR